MVFGGLMNDPFEPMNGLFGLVTYFEVVRDGNDFLVPTKKMGIKKQPV